MRIERKTTELGRTMLEVIMALLVLGMITVGGYAGVRYGLGLSQAWRAQAAVESLAKDVVALYAWRDNYATLNMSGSRGICNTIVTPGNPKCLIISPWGKNVTVEKGASTASFKIVYHDTPKSICEHLSKMRFTDVFMADKSCNSSSQNIEFLMDKDDKACPEGCPSGYDCVNGVCRSNDREDACKNVNCGNECLTGECRGGACVRKRDGVSCSIGICQSGNCVEEMTEMLETTMPYEETTTPYEETTTPYEETTTTYKICSEDEPLMDKNGNCYACNTTENVVLDLETSGNCSVCSSRVYLGDYTCRLDCPSDHIMDSRGTCQPCNSSYSIEVIGFERMCTQKCPNRQLGGSYCNKKCTGSALLIDTYGNCRGCTVDGYDFKVIDNPNCTSLCPNRKVEGNYCVVNNKCGISGTTNASKPLMDYRGNCYACDTVSSVAMGDLPEKMCSGPCPDRFLGLYDYRVYCAPKSCSADKPLKNSEGTCYSCSEINPVYLRGVTSNCSACPNRKLIGDYCSIPCGTGIHVSNPLMESDGKCYACNYPSNVSTGTKERCDVCSNRVFLERSCRLNKCTTSVSPLMDASGNCYACNTTTAVNVGSSGTCSSTCSNRIMVGNYCRLNICSGLTPLIDGNGVCYACDTSTNVKTSLTACNACSNRMYASTDGTCRKACPSDQMMDYYGACKPCTFLSDIYVSGVEENCEKYCGSSRSLNENYCYLDCSKTNPSNPLKDNSSNCTSCGFSYSLPMSKNPNCMKVCPNRLAVGADCILDQKCGIGVNASKPLMDKSGDCHACDTSYNVYVFGIESTCTAKCPSRTLAGSYCVNTCVGKPLLSQNGVCYSCDTSGIVDSQITNCFVCPNRHNAGSSCLLNCPSSTPLQAYWGECYRCDHDAGVQAASKEACESVCPNRKFVNSDFDNCYKTCSSGQFMTRSGCFSCMDSGKIDASHFTVECSKSCPNRALVEGKYCILK